MVKRRRSKRKKNPITKSPIEDFVDNLKNAKTKDFVFAAAGTVGLHYLDDYISKKVEIDLTGLGRVGTASAKLGIGVALANFALPKDSDISRTVQLTAIFGAVKDLAQGAYEHFVKKDEDESDLGLGGFSGLGEIVSHPASQGQVALDLPPEYHDVALGNVIPEFMK